MKKYRLALILLFVFGMSILLFTAVIYVLYYFNDPLKSSASKRLFESLRNGGCFFIFILTASSSTIFLNSKGKFNEKGLSFWSFYLMPILLVLTGVIYFFINPSNSFKSDIAIMSLFVIPFFMSLTIAYLWSVKQLKKNNETT